MQSVTEDMLISALQMIDATPQCVTRSFARAWRKTRKVKDWSAPAQLVLICLNHRGWVNSGCRTVQGESLLMVTSGGRAAVENWESWQGTRTSA